jgi:hypothetical protein
MLKQNEQIGSENSIPIIDQVPGGGGEGMKIPPEEYEVGYGRPPKSTRWKKGQCGNPNRVRKRRSKPAVDMIDEFFATEIDIGEQGISRRVTNFEAIVLQLWIKAVTGPSKRALNVLLKYQEFAASRGDGLRQIVAEVVPDQNSGVKNG